MSTSESFYRVLGVEPSATENEITKAYRKLAQQFHPDKFKGDPSKFTTIQNAYETLKDPMKRNAYDRGERFEEAPMPNFHKQKTPGHVTTSLFLTLEELYTGVSKEVSITRNRFCTDCKGLGGHGTALVCNTCEGKGKRLLTRSFGPMVQQMLQVCPGECKGCGTYFSESCVCKTCHGEKFVSETKSLLIHVDKGAASKSEIWLHQEGSDYDIHQVSSDVTVTIHQKEHERFERKGLDLMSHIELSISEALCGFTRPFPLLNERVLKLHVPPGTITAPGTVKHIADEGMINKGCRGHLFIIFDVVFPDVLSLETVAQLQLLFPTQEMLLSGTEEECEMIDGSDDPTVFLDEKEEQEHFPSHPVQCAQS